MWDPSHAPPPSSENLKPLYFSLWEFMKDVDHMYLANVLHSSLSCSSTTLRSNQGELQYAAAKMARNKQQSNQQSVY